MIATKKGVNVLERGSQVHFMGEFQALLDFPPVSKLGIDGRLDPSKANYASCHAPPNYTDNSTHNLRTKRFFAPRLIKGRMANTDCPMKTFTLRGTKTRRRICTTAVY